MIEGLERTLTYYYMLMEAFSANTDQRQEKGAFCTCTNFTFAQFSLQKGVLPTRKRVSFRRPHNLFNRDFDCR